MRGFENHDQELEPFEPLYPHPEGPLDKPVYQFLGPSRSEKVERVEEKEWKTTDDVPDSYPYSCYSQSGRLVSASHPRGEIIDYHMTKATLTVEKRLAIMQKVLHQWIDYILDSRLPIAHWEDEKDNWKDRDTFERHLWELKAEKSKRDQEAWHENHQCGYYCRWWKPEIPTSDDGKDEEGDKDDDSVYGLGSGDDEKHDVDADGSQDNELNSSRSEQERIRDEEEQEERNREEEEQEGFKRKVELQKWVEGLPHAKTREEIETKRAKKHRSISFISVHEYHTLEGNKDEMDDPARYL
jgi:hypothetical protein